jgi:hypothetical protein
MSFSSLFVAMRANARSSRRALLSKSRIRFTSARRARRHRKPLYTRFQAIPPPECYLQIALYVCTEFCGTSAQLHSIMDLTL